MDQCAGIFCFKGTICNFFALKIAKITTSMLYIFFSCVLTLSRLFPTTFKPGEICNLIRRHGPFLYFRFVAVNGVISALSLVSARTAIATRAL